MFFPLFKSCLSARSNTKYERKNEKRERERKRESAREREREKEKEREKEGRINLVKRVNRIESSVTE